MFKVGKPVTAEDFFDRSKMLREVRHLLRDHQDFMIKAPRRYGKTSLIKQALADVSSPYLYLDLRRESRLENVAEQIVDFSFSLVGVSGFFRRMRENVAKLLINARHELTIRTDIFEYSVEFFSDAKKSPCEMLIQALETAERIATEIQKEFIIVFDEFQDMTRFPCDGDILEMMRGGIQHHEHVTFAFLGSIEHLMTQIFENKKSPFYNFCRKLKLSAFDVDELAPQLIRALKTRRIVLDDPELLLSVLRRLSGHPANTMLVMQHLYFLAIDRDIRLVTHDMLEEAYRGAFGEVHDLVEQYVHELKTRKHYYDVLCRLARGEAQTLKAQALNQVYKGLVELGYINNISRGEYVINDGFLAEYARGFEV